MPIARLQQHSSDVCCGRAHRRLVEQRERSVQRFVDDGVDALRWCHRCSDADRGPSARWMIACAPSSATDLAALHKLHAPHYSTDLAGESVTAHQSPPNSCGVASRCDSMWLPFAIHNRQTIESTFGGTASGHCQVAPRILALRPCILLPMCPHE